MQPTEPQMQAMQVAYALDMIATLPPHTDDAALPTEIQNACVESFFTNLRLLIEFLVRKHDPRDIHRYDFRPGWDPAAGEKIDRLNDDWDFASKTVVHLSKARLPGPDFVLQNYDARVLAFMAMRVLDVMTGFVEALEAANHPLASQFRAGLSLALAARQPVV